MRKWSFIAGTGVSEEPICAAKIDTQDAIMNIAGTGSGMSMVTISRIVG